MDDVNEPLRLMAVLAHPDDESLGMGGVLARYAQEGIATYVVTATRGQRGRFFDNSNRPDDDEVGRVREEELRCAVRELGVRELTLLDYRDGDLDRADPAKAIAAIAAHLRRVRPHVVLTFDEFGAYGHPDHIAICQFATAATVAAADPARAPTGRGRRDAWRRRRRRSPLQALARRIASPSCITWSTTAPSGTPTRRRSRRSSRVS